MFWLEARFELDWGYAVLAGSQYLSNRGEMRQHLPADYDHQPYIWLEASTSLDEAEEDKILPSRQAWERRCQLFWLEASI